MPLDPDGWPVVEGGSEVPDPLPNDVFEDEEPFSKKKDGRSSKNAKKNRKANSGSFGHGKPVGDHYRKIPPKPVPGEGFLRDMRHCLVNPKIRDRTPGEKAARHIFQTQPLKFFEKLEKLEAEETARTNNIISSGPDLGHDAACRVLDRLLAEATS